MTQLKLSSHTHFTCSSVLFFRAMAIMKARLKGAQKGHSLLKKKSDALTMRFRLILKKIIEVGHSHVAARLLLALSLLSIYVCIWYKSKNFGHLKNCYSCPIIWTLWFLPWSNMSNTCSCRWNGKQSRHWSDLKEQPGLSKHCITLQYAIWTKELIYLHMCEFNCEVIQQNIFFKSTICFLPH